MNNERYGLFSAWHCAFHILFHLALTTILGDKNYCLSLQMSRDQCPKSINKLAKGQR